MTCNARLESPDAGLRNVLYDFRISSEDPETAGRIHIADGFTKPDLVVEVKKKVLSVTIPDGKKVYGKPAQMAYIWPDAASELEMNAGMKDGEGGTVPPDRILRAAVSGFLTDEKGFAVIQRILKRRRSRLINRCFRVTVRCTRMERMQCMRGHLS